MNSLAVLVTVLIPFIFTRLFLVSFINSNLESYQEEMFSGH